MDLAHLWRIGVLRGGCSESSSAAAATETGVQNGGVSPETLKEWEALQNSLRPKLRDEDDSGWSVAALRRVGGLDIGFEVGTNKATAVLIICELPTEECPGLQIVYEDAIDVDMDLPYVSGFLFIREMPGYRELLRRLRASAPQLEPDIYLVDGSGMYHPREFGSACHLGVEQNIRTIGVAKKLLTFQDFAQDAADKVHNVDLPNLGDHAMIVGTASQRVYGMALRTSAMTSNKKQQKEISKKRVYVSVGHRVSLSTAKDVIMMCCDITGGSYIPEPIRLADLTGRAIERQWKELHTTSEPQVRQLVIDVCNLLDEKQRRTMLGILEDRDPMETLSAIPLEELKRKRSVIDELFQPFANLYKDARVGEVRVALKMEKPWTVSLKKDAAALQKSGNAMRTLA